MPSGVRPSGPMRWALTANKAIPVFASSGNANMPVQSAIWGCRPFYWNPQNTGTGVIFGPNAGGSVTSSGTFTNPSIATTNLYTLQGRGSWASVVTTANQQLGIRMSPAASLSWYRTTGTAGQGGFLFVCRFGFETWTAGDRLFVGMSSASANLTSSNPSATINMCGFGIDAGDTAITFMHNDGSGTATKTAITGTTLANNQGYDAYIFCKPNDTVVYYRLDDTNAGTTLADTSTASDLPASGTQLGFAGLMGNAANTVVGNATIGIVSIYIETDR